MKTNGDVVAAYNEIITLRFERTQTLNDIRETFFDIMRRHGIKHTVPNYNEKGEVVSRSMATPEWNLCKLALDSIMGFYFTLDFLIDVPKDVE